MSVIHWEDNMNDLVQTILTVLGSGALFGFIQFLITRRDNKDEKLKKMEENFQKGLDERERTGKNRYDEHKIAIEKMTIEHQKDFQALLKAIEKLTDNDTKTTELVKNNQETIEVIADGVVGIMHNTIIHITDPILERGAVTYDELDTLDSLYKPYSRLGGNGACKRRTEDVNKLPKIEAEEAVIRDREIAKKRYKSIQEDISA